MPEYVPIYRAALRPPELEGWAEIVWHDSPHYMSDGSLNPFVYGEVRFLGEPDRVVGRVFRFADIRSEPPPLGSTGGA